MKLKCCDLKHKEQKLKQTVGFLKAISDENRLNILCVLKNKSLSVAEIWQYLKLPQNLVSHHLKVLRDYNLVESKKDGLKTIYSLNLAQLNQSKVLLDKFV